MTKKTRSKSFFAGGVSELPFVPAPVLLICTKKAIASGEDLWGVILINFIFDGDWQY